MKHLLTAHLLTGQLLTGQLLAALLLAALYANPAASQDAESVTELEGVWHVTASNEDGSRKLTWTFEDDGKKLSGKSHDHENDNKRDFDRIMIDGKAIKLEMDMEQNGVEGMIRIEAKEKVAGKLDGEWSVVGKDGTEYMSGDMVAEREVAFAGEWEAVSVLRNGNELEAVFNISGENSKLQGKIEGDGGDIEIEKLKAEPRSLHLEFELDMNGQTIECTIKAKADGDNKLAGEWSVPGDNGETTGKWTAVRKQKSLAGKWNVVATVPNSADYMGTLTLAEKDGKYSGTSQSNNSDANELKTVKINGKRVMFVVPFEQDGNEGTITVNAKVQKDGSLKGEWVLTSDDGTEYARESWSASK